MCGRPYNQCTKEDLMEYLGVDNPTVPFPIYFELTNNTFQNNYYNQSTFLCNEPVQTPYENQSMCIQYVSINNAKIRNVCIFLHARIVPVHLLLLFHPTSLANIRSKSRKRYITKDFNF